MRPERVLEHPTLDTICAAYAGVVIERQARLSSLFGDLAWSVDVAAGRLVIGARELAVQVVAHEDAAAHTWRWAWPDSFAEGQDQARLGRLIDIGTRFDVPELTTQALRLSAIHEGVQGPGHTLAIAACGLLGRGGYLPAAYDGGTAWLLIADDSLPPIRPDAESAARTLHAATRIFPHAQRLTVETYLGVHRIATRDEGDRLTAEISGNAVTFSFDDADRLTAIA